MDQGFWLFLIFQLVALGALSDRMHLVGLRRYALMLGIACSVGAAFLLLLLNHAAIGTDAVRIILKWLALFGMTGSVLATAASVVLPAEISRKS
jgi:hypothetical protein